MARAPGLGVEAGSLLLPWGVSAGTANRTVTSKMANEQSLRNQHYWHVFERARTHTHTQIPRKSTGRRGEISDQGRKWECAPGAGHAFLRKFHFHRMRARAPAAFVNLRGHRQGKLSLGQGAHTHTLCRVRHRRYRHRTVACN
uniref:Putative secreted protein n=1 Tax=Anopheles darlingi TaxID=43151 RepID=A0A2M4D4A4_ANODA